MNAGVIVITALTAVGSVGGAVFAWVQAKAAVESLQAARTAREDAKNAKSDAEAAQRSAEEARDEALELSRKATAAFERQAAAQEEANRLTVEANRVQEWSPVRFNTYEDEAYLVNTSKRGIEVLRIDSVPHPGEVDESTLERLPLVVSAGDELKISSRLTWRGSGAKHLEIEWRFTDDPPEQRHSTRRSVEVPNSL